MVTVADESKERQKRPLVYLSTITLLFIFAFAGRTASFQPHLLNDDGYYLRATLSILEGNWLGDYGPRTLATGPGFPLFLALARHLGLTYLAAYATVYAASAIFLSKTLSDVLRVRLLYYLLPPMLFALPVLADHSTAQVQRNLLVSVLAMIALAATIHVTFMQSPLKWMYAVVGGLSVGLLWITREDGVWILPAIFSLVIFSWIKARNLYALLPFIGSAVAAVGVASITVAANFATYGQAIVNDQASGAFPRAMKALYSASSPYSRTRIPVPQEAREAIYQASPTFAELRPILDPPIGQNAWVRFGCEQDERACGDIGGGWFVWAFRGAVHSVGGYGSPQAADDIYNKIAQEVTDACSRGQLDCRYWPLSTLPPVNISDIGDLLYSAGKIAKLFLFYPSIDVAVPPSSVDSGTDRYLYQIVGSPRVISLETEITLSGWYRSVGSAWFEVKGATVQRLASPDIAAYFDDPEADHQRFAMTIACQDGTCIFEVGGMKIDANTLSDGASLSLPDGGIMHFDDVTILKQTTLANHISDAWIAISAMLSPVYAILFSAGALIFILMVYGDWRLQQFQNGTMICIVLWTAIAGRAAILVIVDAISFDAANYPYALPAFPLLAAVSLTAALSYFSRPIPDGPNDDPSVKSI